MPAWIRSLVISGLMVVSACDVEKRIPKTIGEDGVPLAALFERTVADLGPVNADDAEAVFKFFNDTNSSYELAGASTSCTCLGATLSIGGREFPLPRAGSGGAVFDHAGGRGGSGPLLIAPGEFGWVVLRMALASHDVSREASLDLHCCSDGLGGARLKIVASRCRAFVAEPSFLVSETNGDVTTVDCLVEVCATDGAPFEPRVAQAPPGLDVVLRPGEALPLRSQWCVEVSGVLQGDNVMCPVVLDIGDTEFRIPWRLGRNGRSRFVPNAASFGTIRSVVGERLEADLFMSVAGDQHSSLVVRLEDVVPDVKWVKVELARSGGPTSRIVIETLAGIPKGLLRGCVVVEQVGGAAEEVRLPFRGWVQ